MKEIQIARMYCRGWPYPRQAKIIGEEGATLPEQSPWESQKRFQALRASHKSMVEKQLQEKLSPPY